MLTPPATGRMYGAVVVLGPVLVPGGRASAEPPTAAPRRAPTAMAVSMGRTWRARRARGRAWASTIRFLLGDRVGAVTVDAKGVREIAGRLTPRQTSWQSAASR